MTTAAPGRGRGEQAGQDGQDGQGGQDPLIPPDPTSLEAWMRQVLGLAGARASAFRPPLPTPPLPSTGPAHPGRSADVDGPDPGGNAK